MRSWPSKVSVARMRMKRRCPGSSASSAASSLLIGRHCGEGDDGSWQAPLLTTRHMTDCGVQRAGHAAGLDCRKQTVTSSNFRASGIVTGPCQFFDLKLQFKT